MLQPMTYTAAAKDSGRMVKHLLADRFSLSRRTITRLKQNGGILLNGQAAALTAVVKENDVLTIVWTEQDRAKAQRIAVTPEILYQDESLIIVNKPYGMPCHPSKEHPDDDMVTLLKKYLNLDAPLHPVGRLDKDVSGIMVYALTARAASRLSKAREEHGYLKEYEALIEGIPETKEGLLETFASKDGKMHRMRYDPQGQRCLTEYSVLKEYENYSLVKVRLKTGRTHQIRFTFSHYGHPLSGDPLYGHKTPGIYRPALHCFHVAFRHPFKEKTIDLTAPLPEDMADLVL